GARETARLLTPFFVSGMTAGHAHAVDVNRALAQVCQARGWAMGVGSQRRDLETLAHRGNGHSGPKKSGLFSVDGWREFREEFSDLYLISNIGLSQAICADTEELE